MINSKKEKIHINSVYEYEFFCGLGGNCSTQHFLRKLNLQAESLPFDAVYGQNILTIIELFKTNFTTFFQKKYLKFEGKSLEPITKKHIHDRYKNIKTNINFIHHFATDRTFDQQYTQVKSTFDRRIKRMFKKIKHSKRVLFIFNNHPSLALNVDNMQLILLIDEINKINENSELLFFEHNAGLSRHEHIEEYVTSHIRKITINNSTDSDDPFEQLYANKDKINEILSAYKLKESNIRLKKCIKFIAKIISCLIPISTIRTKAREFIIDALC